MYLDAPRHRLWISLLLATGLAAPALLLVTRPGARAQEPDRSVRPGRQEVSVEIDDRRSLAITTVRLELANSSGQERPAVCKLPVPDDAAFLRFQVLSPPPRKDEKPQERGGVSPAGHNMYQVRAARVPAHGRARVELAYAQALVRRGTRRKYVYPMSGAEWGGSTPLSVRIRIVASAPPENVVSVTYPLALRRPGPRVAALSYDSSRPPEGRDLVVDYQVAPLPDDALGRLAVYTPRDPAQDPYFLLALPPPASMLHGDRAAEAPADIVFCLDISGSTKGRKLSAIEEAVHDGLADLTPRDRFGVVAFDDDARPFRRALLPAAGGAVSQAVRWVNRLPASGGSDPGRGLQAAVEVLGDRRKAGGRAGIIAILVDDQDPADLAATAAQLHLERRGIRVVMLGAMPDARLIDYRLRGHKIQKGPAIALSRAAVTYGSSLSAAAFDPGPLNPSYVYPPPERLPDLPLSTPVLLFGRLNQAPPARGTVSLTGKLEGRVKKLSVAFSGQALDAASPVPALWANRRVRRLQQLAGRKESGSTELTTAAQHVQAEHGLAAVPEP
jgi:Ca-activated chloride channel family protein